MGTPKRMTVELNNGERVEVSRATGLTFIASGKATRVDDAQPKAPAKPRAKSKGKETATAAPADENAAL